MVSKVSQPKKTLTMKKNFIPLLILILGSTLLTQVGIGTETPSPSSLLDIASANKGVLIPRVSLNGTNDITTIEPENVESLLVYNTNTTSIIEPGYYSWNDNKWIRILTSEDNMEGGASTEPWYEQGSNNQAISNNQDIYQTGSVAIGKKSILNENSKLDVHGAVRFGYENVDTDEAVGYFSFAHGNKNIASAFYSFAVGVENNIDESGQGSIAFGLENISVGSYSFGVGERNEIRGTTSIAMGTDNTTMGNGSIALGNLNKMIGSQSIGLGRNHTVASFLETSIGDDNAIKTGDALKWIDKDPLFQVGKQSGNALTILKDGYVGIGILGTESAAKPTAMLDVGSGDVKIRSLAGANGEANDRVVVVNSEGVLKSVARGTYAQGAALLVENKPTFLYSPAANLPTHTIAANGQQLALTSVQRVDLYKDYYVTQFGTDNTSISSLKSPGAKSIPTLSASQLDYYITWYDTNVYTNMSINEAGILTYSVKPNAVATTKTYINIAFKIKD